MQELETVNPLIVKIDALPGTGGIGTSLYTMAGWMLLLCTAACLLYKYDCCKRGNSKAA